MFDILLEVANAYLKHPGCNCLIYTTFGHLKVSVYPKFDHFSKEIMLTFSGRSRGGGGGREDS